MVEALGIIVDRRPKGRPLFLVEEVGSFFMSSQIIKEVTEIEPDEIKWSTRLKILQIYRIKNSQLTRNRNFRGYILCQRKGIE